MRRGRGLAGSALLPLGLVFPVGLAMPLQADELALRQSGEARIVLDLKHRQIIVVRSGRQLGPWPVAIGDPQTPTPRGDFSILTKKVNPVYVTHKG